MTLTSEPKATTAKAPKAGSSPAIDPVALRADFPILQQEINGHRLVYLDSASSSQKPARRHRRARRLLPRVQRQRPPRDLHDRREGHGRVRGGPRQGRALHQRPGPPRDHLHPQRDRGDQPRRLRVGSQEHRPRRRDRPHRDGAPREPRPVAAPGPGEGRRPRVHPDHRRRRAPPRRARGAAPPEARSSSRSPTSRTRSARSTRSARWSRWRTPPARSCWSTARRPCRTCRSTSRRSAPTSTRSAATRCSARWAPARCGPGASCSRRCRRSWPAAR